MADKLMPAWARKYAKERACTVCLHRVTQYGLKDKAGSRVSRCDAYPDLPLVKSAKQTRCRGGLFVPDAFTADAIAAVHHENSSNT